jgi:hypothetical protein
MDREEVEQILSEGSVNPKYQAALSIAKQNGWMKDINTTDAKMPEKKSVKEKLFASSDDMKKMTENRTDVKNAVKRAEVANPAVGVIDRVAGNVTGLKEDLLDPHALKAKDLNSDGSIIEKGFQVGNGSDGDFVSVEKKTVKNAPAPKGETGTSGTTQQNSPTANRQNADMTIQQGLEKQKVQEEKEKNWNNTLDSAKKMYEASKNIDDHYIENLPKTILGAYKAGEFGDVGSKEAKQRLAYFMVDNFANVLKTFSNAAAANAGRGPIFSDIENQWDKMQKTNLANAIENRWKKYETETANAMDLIKQRGFADEDINEAIDKVSANNRLQTAFNRATEDEKAYVLEVMTEIGDKIGNMNDTEFVNTIMGMASMGESLDWKEAAGMLVYRFVKDPEKRKDALDSLGFSSGDSSNSGTTGLKGAIVHELLK